MTTRSGHRYGLVFMCRGCNFRVGDPECNYKCTTCHCDKVGLFDEYESYCNDLACKHFATKKDMDHLNIVAKIISSVHKSLKEAETIWFAQSKGVSLSAAQAVELWSEVPHTVAICHMLFSAVVDWWTLPQYQSFPTFVLCYYAHFKDKTVYQGLEDQLMAGVFPRPYMWTGGPRCENFRTSDLGKMI